MGAVKYTMRGSDYVGAFAVATERYCFVGIDATGTAEGVIAETLKVEVIRTSVGNSGFIGVLARANSNGILLSNLAEEREIDVLRKACTGMNISVMESALNAVGNNILANDKIAIVNPDYSAEELRQINDTLGVEAVRAETGGFKTVGANNILTNAGLVVNNRSTDLEKERIDALTGFESVRTTANSGSLGIGISTLANSKGVMAGAGTTGFELSRIMEALNLND